MQMKEYLQIGGRAMAAEQYRSEHDLVGERAVPKNTAQAAYHYFREN